MYTESGPKATTTASPKVTGSIPSPTTKSATNYAAISSADSVTNQRSAEPTNRSNGCTYCAAVLLPDYATSDAASRSPCERAAIHFANLF